MPRRIYLKYNNYLFIFWNTFFFYKMSLIKNCWLWELIVVGGKALSYMSLNKKKLQLEPSQTVASSRPTSRLLVKVHSPVGGLVLGTGISSVQYKQWWKGWSLWESSIRGVVNPWRTIDWSNFITHNVYENIGIHRRDVHKTTTHSLLIATKHSQTHTMSYWTH